MVGGVGLSLLGRRFEEQRNAKLFRTCRALLGGDLAVRVAAVAFVPDQNERDFSKELIDKFGVPSGDGVE